MSGGIAALVLHPGETCHWTNLGRYAQVEKEHDKDGGGGGPRVREQVGDALGHLEGDILDDTFLYFIFPVPIR